jgi:hypothetical protein
MTSLTLYLKAEAYAGKARKFFMELAVEANLNLWYMR